MTFTLDLGFGFPALVLPVSLLFGPVSLLFGLFIRALGLYWVSSRPLYIEVFGA